jgi:hypothetical protein
VNSGDLGGNWAVDSQHGSDVDWTMGRGPTPHVRVQSINKCYYSLVCLLHCIILYSFFLSAS